MSIARGLMVFQVFWRVEQVVVRVNQMYFTAKCVRLFVLPLYTNQCPLVFYCKGNLTNLRRLSLAKGNPK
jgi:hypothetical protein